MPRYFFHTHIGGEVVTDPDGEELRDPDRAWEAARTLALQLLQGADGDPDLIKAVLVVEDAAGEVVFEFPLAEVLAADPPPGPAGTIH